MDPQNVPRNVALTFVSTVLLTGFILGCASDDKKVNDPGAPTVTSGTTRPPANDPTLYNEYNDIKSGTSVTDEDVDGMSDASQRLQNKRPNRKAEDFDSNADVPAK